MKTAAQIGTISTEALREQHQSLNCERRRGVIPAVGQSVQEAKKQKCFAKDELIKRASVGDDEAIEYARKRKWAFSAIQTVAVPAE